MITHEEAKQQADICTVESYNIMIDYITQQEQFAKDVVRYFELRSKANRFLMENEDELREFWKLEEKLQKVGKEE